MRGLEQVIGNRRWADIVVTLSCNRTGGAEMEEWDLSPEERLLRHEVNARESIGMVGHDFFLMLEAVGGNKPRQGFPNPQDKRHHPKRGGTQNLF
jgi:hypothetical protein